MDTIKYSFGIPTKVYQEQGAVKNHKEVFSVYGQKAFIVTGKHSAKACGALEDVTQTLEDCSVEYKIFNEIENNPSVETVEKGASLAKEFGADYIIGIGGGSPIDASKAIAVLAANTIKAVDLFKNQFNDVLPIIAIPTTAGTGSEVTPYSVLVRKDMQTKVSFGTNKTFPAYAFLDFTYTTSLGVDITINTAIDAFTHSLEGYLSNRSTIFSDMLAKEAIQTFGECIDSLEKKEWSNRQRERLMYVSMLGGMVIAHTGVMLPHGMGYCYTFFKGTPHGKANGYLTVPVLREIYQERKEKIDRVLVMVGSKNLDDFEKKLLRILGRPPKISEEEVQKFAQLTKVQKGSIGNTPINIEDEKLVEIWRKIKILAEQMEG